MLTGLGRGLGARTRKRSPHSPCLRDKELGGLALALGLGDDLASAKEKNCKCENVHTVSSCSPAQEGSLPAQFLSVCGNSDGESWEAPGASCQREIPRRGRGRREQGSCAQMWTRARWAPGGRGAGHVGSWKAHVSIRALCCQS